jgi:MFS family permease
MSTQNESVGQFGQKNTASIDTSEKASATGDESFEQQAEPLEPKQDAQMPAREISGWKWVVVIAAIYSSQFLFALDNTIVANVQPVIVNEFDAVDKLSWLSVSFLIGAAGTNLAWGKAYAQFNAKWTYIGCVLFFEIGSAICGAAPTIDAFIIGRAICGVSGAGMYVGLMTLIAVTTTMHERPMYVSGGGLVWGIGTVLGPIVGGAFTDSSATWRWSFYINLCVGAVCAPVYLFMLPNRDPRPGVSLLDRAREMDYVGAVLMVGAFVAGVMAVSFGGVMYPWGSPTIIGLFCCSGVLFFILGLQQAFTIFTTVTRRICPVEFFKSRTVLILFAMTSAGGTAIFLPIYMAPLFFQFTRGDNALESGVRLLPFIMVMIVAVIANGALLSKFGYYMPWYLAGGVFVAVGGGLMYTVGASTSAANVYGYTVIIGIGVGLFAQASFSVAQAVVEPAMIPSAVGFISTAQIFGITIALAIANAIFLNTSKSGIHAILPDVATKVIEQTIAGAKSDFFQNLPAEIRAQVLEVIVNSQAKTYTLVIAAGALAAILSLLLKREKLFVPAGAGGGP